MSKIVEIEGYEFEQKSRFRYKHLHKDRCAHRKFTMDDQGMTIHCSDCGDQISAYWIVEEIIDSYLRRLDDLKHKRTYAVKINEDLEKEHKFLKVLRNIQRAWRGKNKMAVCCPWCKIGIMPEDGLGNTTITPDLDFKRRRIIEDRKNEMSKCNEFFKINQETE